MSSIDVKGPIDACLQRANKQFDAAMDALVPPTAEQLLARDYPATVALAQIMHAFDTAIKNFTRAFGNEMNRLDERQKQ